jgi:hypothetical protein
MFMHFGVLIPHYQKIKYEEKFNCPDQRKNTYHVFSGGGYQSG